MRIVSFQLVEQVKFLNKTIVHIAVGTPNRITQLLEHGKQFCLCFTMLCVVSVFLSCFCCCVLVSTN